ncbi:hypothetical protein ATCCBAA256_36160 [Mycobacterium montefiorense]|nr:hypothetical protein ATCCBAA256_36160 [Mycobacterium montefiorense]
MVSSSGAGLPATPEASDPPFHFGTRCHILTTIVTRSTIVVETVGEALHMDRETETDTELVTETLVEEVSIDGMCGVY